MEACSTCNGNVRVPVYACEIHQRCSLKKKTVNADTFVCNGCSDRLESQLKGLNMEQITKAITALTEAKTQLEEAARLLIGGENKEVNQLISQANELGERAKTLEQMAKRLAKPEQ